MLAARAGSTIARLRAYRYIQYLSMPNDYHQELIPGAYYHVYNRAVASESIFSSKWAIAAFLSRWNTYIEPYADSVAYCLMPNHFHFMLRVKPAEEWDEKKMRQENTTASAKLLAGQSSHNDFLVYQLIRALSGFSLSYNKRKKRHGSVFQEGVKRICLRTESRLWWQLCYIHHNGIHHGFVFDYDEWQHSSYHDYVVRDWAQLPDHLQWLGEAGQEARQRFFQEHERFKASWAQERLDQDSDIEPLV